MNRMPGILVLACALAVLPGATPTRALAAPATPAVARPAATPAVAKRTAPATARRSGVTAAKGAADTTARTRPRVAPRTLEDIHIEGEIPVPQVLFITAREQRRILGFQHHRYARTSLELGEATPVLSGAVVTRPAPVPRKETPR